jgi:hypothetical protein
MSVPTASCLPSTKAKEAMKYVIGTVLDFNPVDDCPLWLALIHDAMDENNFKPKLSRKPKFTGLCRICTRPRRNRPNPPFGNFCARNSKTPQPIHLFSLNLVTPAVS